MSRTFGLDVNRLIRLSFGPFQLLDLAPGAVEVVHRRILADQLGQKLARELGLRDDADAARERRTGAKAAARDGEA